VQPRGDERSRPRRGGAGDGPGDGGDRRMVRKRRKRRQPSPGRRGRSDEWPLAPARQRRSL